MVRGLTMGAMLAVALGGAVSCLGTIDLQSGGGGTGGSGASGAGGGGQGGGHCTAPAVGYCSEPEDCACDACAPAAACSSDGRGCIANGLCDPEFEYTCLCSDCDHGMRGVSHCRMRAVSW